MRMRWLIFLSAVVLTAVGAACGVALLTGMWGESPDLEPFLDSYFASWSKGDMTAYKGHFDRHARIMLLDGGKVEWEMARDPFVRQQGQVIARSSVKLTERMTSYKAIEDETAATVSAEWLLTAGAEETRGVDIFTLMRDADGKWKIVSLMFYTTE